MFFRNSLWFIVLLILLVFWSECILYYMYLLKCTWPTIPKENMDPFIPTREGMKPVKVLLISDTHVANQHHWFDKHRRQWQLTRAFQASMSLHHPDVVVHLGDVLDNGFYETEVDFKSNVDTIRRIFAVDSTTTAFKIIPGNHDIGFHHRLHPYTFRRFSEAFLNSSTSDGAVPVTLWAHRGLLFVILNSMALEGDGCRFCQRAEDALQSVAKKLQCLRGELALESCLGDFDLVMEPGSDPIHPSGYSHPIILQHFPMHRRSEEVCDTGFSDSMPDAKRKEPYKPGIDCLAESTSLQKWGVRYFSAFRILREVLVSINRDIRGITLFHSLRPRLIFGGHTHYFCHRNFTVQLPRLAAKYTAEEWTLPAFSWRVSTHPGFVLLHALPNGYAVHHCHLPTETAIIGSYVLGLVLMAICAIARRRNRSRLVTMASSVAPLSYHADKDL